MNKNKTIGYHGTSKANAVQITGTNQFHDSTDDDDWLGCGVYFFAYKNDAQWWVATSRFKSLATSILSATLEYTDDQMLDLDDWGQMQIFREVVERVVKRMKEEGQPIGVDFTSKNLSKKWCFACNTIRGAYPEIGVISYTFKKDSPDWYTGFHRNQRQICVSDHSIITSIKECEDVSC